VALKPTIYKSQLQLSDSDREIYETIGLTLALHPSETTERLIARLLALALEWQPGLEFGRGLSTSDEPDIWRHSDDGRIEQWIEMGQPEEARLRKGLSRTPAAVVYAFGKSVETWWRLYSDQMIKLQRVTVWELPWEQIVELATALDRNISLSVSISGGVVYADLNGSSVDFSPVCLFSPED